MPRPVYSNFIIPEEAKVTKEMLNDYLCMKDVLVLIFILKHIRGFGEGVLFTSFQLFKSSNLPTTDVSFKYFTMRFCNALIIPILIKKRR